jgi:hypothetical protein
MGISAAIVYSAIYYAWLAARVKFATVATLSTTAEPQQHSQGAAEQ